MEPNRDLLRTPLGISQSYWNAECRRDIDAVMAHYHTDATYEDAGGVRSGHAQIRANYEQHAHDFPGLEVAIIREFGNGDESAIEFDAVVTDTAGSRFRIRGVNVVRVRDGKFVAVRSYEDPPAPE